MSGSLDEVHHLMRGVDRQGMLGESLPRKDVGGHVASQLELLARRLCQQCHHHVFQRDDAHAKMYQLGLSQLRNG